MSNLSTLFDRYKALVVFDTETSGLDFDNDQIIELAALRVERTATGGLRIAGKMDTFIKLPEGETDSAVYLAKLACLPYDIVLVKHIVDKSDILGACVTCTGLSSCAGVLCDNDALVYK